MISPNRCVTPGPLAPADGRAPRQAQRGFTLVELLVTVGIIGILSTIAIGRFRSAQSRARAARIVADFNVVQQAALAYYSDNEGWPPEHPSGSEPTTLAGYLGGSVRWQEGRQRYDWMLWSPQEDNPDSRMGGDLVGLRVTTDDPRVPFYILRIYRGPLLFGPGNTTIFVIDNSLTFR